MFFFFFFFFFLRIRRPSLRVSRADTHPHTRRDERTSGNGRKERESEGGKGERNKVTDARTRT
eukprot:EC684599.1.p5 GENE.EC684599.1~~EC684599.1.p5  ORF type:complete len:63 (-),score=37.57 EC684599.1:277-465(-)